MSEKERKAVLKEVRQAIKDEKYEEAIAKCEDLLKKEPTNYMANLLMGAAYQSSNKIEAAKYLRKAVEYSPAAPTVALQGLANCAPPEELPKVYERLLELVPEKQQEYYEKLYNVAADNNNVVALECFNVFKSELSNCDDEDRKRSLLKYMARLWVGKDIEVISDDEETYKSALESVIEDPTLDVHLIAYKRYLKLLFNQKHIDSCLDHASKVVEQYPLDIYAYEWICKIYCEFRNSSEASSWCEALQHPIEYYGDELLKLDNNSGLAMLVKAIKLYESQQFVAARELLDKVQTVQPNYMVAVQLLAQTEMQLAAFEMALPLWQQCGEEFQLQYALCSAQCEDSDKLNEAVVILRKYESKVEITNALARCYFKLGKIDALKDLSLDILAKAEFLFSPAEAIELLQTSPSVDQESFATLMLLGKLYLKLEDYVAALSYVLKATRLQPQRADCFYYLGKIYLVTNDLVRSRKCFEKCINLNPLCRQAMENLSALYQQLGEEDLNVALLSNTLKYLKTSERSKHVHYKLGLHYLNVRNYDEAIQSFRTAIKYDVNCTIYWESLGDAYAERGSFNSAIRVFQKILELQPDNIYAKLQIALVKTTIRMYPEAIEDFDNLLKEHPDYLPGLKGAAEAHIGLANNLKLECRYARCKSHLQMAVNHLQRAFLYEDNLKMVWLWQLTANVFLQTSQMPESMANLDVSGVLAKRDTEVAFLTRRDLLNLAIRFYTCALKIKQNTYLWYELALCSYYCSDYLPEEAQSHLEMATKACQMAIKEERGRWQNWNLLGVINMHRIINNLPMAQHCFIQALNLERKSYTTWTNLGVLYLKLHEIKLANQAFQRAQQSRPIYGNAWIGQAMIAEAINDEEEAMDLFRHCQQFEFHTEAAIGYAHWVCSVLSDAAKCELPHNKHAIESMHADVVALDAINWYVINEEREASVSALSFLGFLSERQKLYRPAVKAYSMAAQKATVGAERDAMLTNLGFLYLKLNEPNEAINAFNKVTQASFKPIIGLALAYFRAGQHQEAYSVYNSVLKSVAGVEDDKAARILVAMASMVYAFQGEADTKTILYQCILLKDSPIQALYSACALGIIHHDNQLTETILTELKKHENSVNHCSHIAYLTSQYYLANNEPRKGLTYIMRRVHIFPHCAELRKILANFLLDNYSHRRQYQVATSQIALSAIALVHSSKSRKSDCIEDAEIRSAP